MSSKKRSERSDRAAGGGGEAGQLVNKGSLDYVPELEQAINQIEHAVTIAIQNKTKSTIREENKKTLFDRLINRIHGQIILVKESQLSNSNKEKLLKRLDIIISSLSESFQYKPPSPPKTDAISTLIMAAEADIKRYEDATTASYVHLSDTEKGALSIIIQTYGPGILQEYFLQQSSGLPDTERDTVVAFQNLTYMLTYINLCERLLPTFFGKIPQTDNLYLPDHQTETGRLQIIHALKSVQTHMFAIKPFSDSIAELIQHKYPSIVDFIKNCIVMFLTTEVLTTAAPMIHQIAAYLTKNPLSLGDINAIFAFLINYRAQIGLIYVMSRLNWETIKSMTSSLFYATIGYGLPIDVAVNPIHRVFDRLIEETRQPDAMGVLRWPDNPLMWPIHLLCIVRNACVGQFAAARASVETVPKLLKGIPAHCSRAVSAGREFLSKKANDAQAGSGTLSLTAFNSFHECLAQEIMNPDYDSIRDLPEVLRCFDNMGAHHLDPSLVTEPRVKFVSARDVIMQRDNESAVVALTKRKFSEENESSQLPQPPLSPQHLEQVMTEADNVHVEHSPDTLGYQGEVLVMGDVTPHTSGPIGPEGGVSSATNSDLFAYNFGKPPVFQPPKSNGRGGATRNKRATKKYKSKKNKRQSRRKLRRASSRKGRK
jgi:hypothetical protein